MTVKRLAGGVAAVGGLALLWGCADIAPRSPGPGAATASVVAVPSHRQYFDQRRGRYYYFDQARHGYFWEDGAPRD